MAARLAAAHHTSPHRSAAASSAAPSTTGGSSSRVRNDPDFVPDLYLRRSERSFALHTAALLAQERREAEEAAALAAARAAVKVAKAEAFRAKVGGRVGGVA